jgi:hypothetical protein
VLVCCRPAEAPSHKSFVAKLCHAECARTEECSPGRDVTSCERTCAERGDPTRAFWREGTVEAVATCL